VIHCNNLRFVTAAILMAAAIALTGCQTAPPAYAQRDLTRTEHGWHRTMTDWYPNWQEPSRPVPARDTVRRLSTTDDEAVITSSAPEVRVVDPPPPVPAPATVQPVAPKEPTPVVQPVFDFPDQRNAAPAGSQPFRVIPEGSTPDLGNKARPQWYSVQKGDTLASIAKRFYGNAEAWRNIYQANRQTLSAPDQLKIGMRLRLP
jgi:nucleoid-associated protein YgaU